MTLEKYFSAGRIGLMLKKDTLGLYRQMLVVTGAIFGVLLAIYLLTVFALSRGGNVTFQFSSEKGPDGLHLGLFTPLIFVGGLIATSRAFYEVHARIRNHDWFMLPASTFEKLTERWLLTSIGYVLAAAVGYTLFSAIAAGVSTVLLKSAYPLFNPLSRAAIMICLNYLVVQSLFLLGAAFFRKNHFLKSVLALIVIAILMAIFGAVVFRLVYWGYFKGMVPDGRLVALFEDLDNSAIPANLERIGTRIWNWAKVFYWALFAPTVLTITYHRLKETEVKDGV